jgi:hypothetical protein
MLDAVSRREILSALGIGALTPRAIRAAEEPYWRWVSITRTRSRSWNRPGQKLKRRKSPARPSFAIRTDTWCK